MTVLPSSPLARRWLPAALALIAFLNALQAQSAGTGAISGRVVNAATSAYLEGAEVTVGGLPPVLTDRNGEFAVSGVPAGGQPVRATYTGLQAGSATVTVRAVQSAEVTLRLHAGGGGRSARAPAGRGGRAMTRVPRLREVPPPSVVAPSVVARLVRSGRFASRCAPVSIPSMRSPDGVSPLIAMSSDTRSFFARVVPCNQLTQWTRLDAVTR